MNKPLILSLSLFAFLAVFEGRAISTGLASDLVEKSATAKKTVSTVLSFEQSFAPTELYFIKRCKDENIELDWKRAREVFFIAAGHSFNKFERDMYRHIPIKDVNLKNKNFQKLYQEYKDFYNNWYGLDSEQKENKKPVVSMASSCSSSSSSSSLSTSTISSTAVEDDADAISSVTPLLRQRHPTTSSSTLEVK